MEETLNINVHFCQRCGETHDMEFRTLANPADEYNYWGLCPNLSQPVLLTIRQVKDKYFYKIGENSNE